MLPSTINIFEKAAKKAGRILARDFGEIENLQIKSKNIGDFVTSDNLKVHPRMKELYKFFKYTGKLVDIQNYNPKILNIFSRKVLKMINSNAEGWEPLLPSIVSNMIKEQQLFGYSKKEVEIK